MTITSPGTVALPRGIQLDPRQPSRILTRFRESARTNDWVGVRLVLFMAWASMPLLAIVGHVFGLLPQAASAALVVPLSVLLLALSVLAPHPSDRIVRAGFIAGFVACLPYDAFRLTGVLVFHWMGDFIPSLGAWITGHAGVEGATVGYLWRYLGDAAGAGVGFFVIAFAFGLHRWSRGRMVAATVVYAICPVWLGLIATVGLSPHGQELMFRLTPATVGITFLGHVIFGFVLGLALVRVRHLGEHWPWPPITLRTLTQRGSVR